MQRQSLLFNCVCSVSGLAAFTVLFNFANPVQALPDQSVQTVVQWAKQHRVLSPLRRGISELGNMPFYTTEGKLKTGNFVFSMSPDPQDRRVRKETIVSSTPQKPQEFTRTNVNGLNLIQQTYDQAIVNDFRQSKYIARVRYNNQDVRFYQGRSFGYMTTDFKPLSTGEKYFNHFTILPLSQLNREIFFEQQCSQQSMDGCE